MDKKMNETLDLSIQYGMATEEELELMIYLDGYNIDISNDIIYAIADDYQLIEQIQGEIVEV